MAGRARGWRSGFWGESRIAIVMLLSTGLVSCQTPAKERESLGLPTPGRIAALRRPGPPTRVVVIAVAGLEASDFLGADGFAATEGDPVRMPRLAGLAREGVIGERAIPPSPGSRYASLASIVTGRSPLRHGIVADSRLEEDGHTSSPFWESDSIKGEALWDAAIGRGVLALNWPTTIGARIELVLPAVQPSERGQSWLDVVRGIASPSLVRDLGEISADALDGDDGPGFGSDRDPLSWPTPSEKDAAMSELACNVAMSERDPGLWLIRFSQTEAILQVAGVGSVQLAVGLGRIDEEIGALVDCLDEIGQLADSAIFVTGDVAYRPVHTRVDPNVALVKAGLIGRDPRSTTGVRSWLAIVRSLGHSAYVYARSDVNAVAAREILEAEARETNAFRVVPALELAKAGVDPQAWFALASKPGFEIGDGLQRPMMRPAPSRAAAGILSLLDEEASAVGFVAWGRGIRNQVRIPRLDLVDLAPTISMLLGLRLDDDIEGVALEGILRASVPAPPPGPKRLGVGGDGNAGRALRDLGGGR